MGRVREPVAQDGVDAGQIAGQQCGHVKPQAGEHDAAGDAVGVGKQRVKAAFAENESVDRGILHAPDKIFAYPIAAISIQLRPQILTHCARRHFRDEFGSALNISIPIDLCLPTTNWIDQKTQVRLRFVVDIEPYRGVIA